MRYKQSRPKWWILYLILPALFGLFSIEFMAPLSPRGHQIAQIAIILLVFRIIWIWLGANEQAIVEEEFEESKRSHQGKLYIVLSPEFLPLEEQMDQRVQRDNPAGQSLVHLAGSLPATRNDSLKHT